MAEKEALSLNQRLKVGVAIEREQDSLKKALGDRILRLIGPNNWGLSIEQQLQLYQAVSWTRTQLAVLEGFDQGVRVGSRERNSEGIKIQDISEVVGFEVQLEVKFDKNKEADNG